MKLGFVDHHLANYHADVFLKLLRSTYADRGVDLIAYESDPAPGDDWCDRNQVPRADSIGEVVDRADALLILAPDNLDAHAGFAEQTLPAGKPVVFDKVLADRVEDARMIFEQAAEHGTPIFSSSALRYAAELADAPSGGPIESGFARGYGAWAGYGIHTLAVATRIGGFGVRRVIDTGTAEDRNLTLDYGSHRISVDCHGGANAGDVLGWTAGYRVGGEWRTATVADYPGFYRRTFGVYLDFCAGVTPDQTPQQAVELVAVHAAADSSLAAGGSWIDLT
ncbi:Gfo/Idh/MocA family oxidoreductase [Microlunatus parietis]|uniref:Putative dehydrogenase n=1 Tax=Microlunatus parietis TaxID=682979 RepID=A0A7Y9I7B4_9ACTN|nr:Gfo/Idh/MocA family oxidoreductase [Microlunatus parietis]NYE71316.1 putative dehydrogenase [Microlunatus parietis]